MNTPDQYRHAHHLPENYDVLHGWTPRSIWFKGDLRIERILNALVEFGDRPLILKDFVKSQKHHWAEACYIPSASDGESVERVVTRFLELQGDNLAEGLVFREYLEFEPIGVHPKSKMPLIEEYRIFWLDGIPIFWTFYWPEGNDEGRQTPIERFKQVAQAVRSRFFSMDVARMKEGDWRIVEIGDGQVSGLTDSADADLFYQSLSQAWPG